MKNLKPDDLLNFRKKFKITQAQLGVLLNIDTSNINRLEKGRRNLTEDFAKKFKKTQRDLKKFPVLFSEKYGIKFFFYTLKVKKVIKQNLSL